MLRLRESSGPTKAPCAATIRATSRCSTCIGNKAIAVARITFVTATDTGVGKTVLTALLLDHLRSSGVNALAIKPFCSGSRSDARLLRKVGDNQLTLDEINPYYFEKPLAPFAAAWPVGRKISIEAVIQRIRRVAAKCDHLLVEGVGGVLVPLGPDFFVADLIAALNCETILVARNKLGTINHTLLSVYALGRARPKSVWCSTFTRSLLRAVVLTQQKSPDLSSKTNPQLLKTFLPGIRISEFPFLGGRAKNLTTIHRTSRRLTRFLDLLR